jgi:hypothetical protein
VPLWIDYNFDIFKTLSRGILGNAAAMVAPAAAARIHQCSKSDFFNAFMRQLLAEDGRRKQGELKRAPSSLTR